MRADRPAKKTETIEVRISREKKRDFMTACRAHSRSASEVIRGFIDGFIADANRAPDRNFLKEYDMARLIRNTPARIAAVTGVVGAAAILATPSAAADPRLEAVFHWYDIDKNGGLTLQEFVNPEKNNAPEFEGVQIVVETVNAPPKGESRAALFQRLDGNRDNIVSFDELKRAVTVKTLLQEPILNSDQDGDGAVTESELATYITARRALMGVKDPAAGAVLMARGIVKVHDKDGDGTVGPEDFAN